MRLNATIAGVGMTRFMKYRDKGLIAGLGVVQQEGGAEGCARDVGELKPARFGV